MLRKLSFVAICVLCFLQAAQGQQLYGTPPACTGFTAGASLPDGLEQCTSLSSAVHLNGINSTDLSPFRNVKTADEFWIENCPNLLEVSFPLLETSKSIIIRNNPKTVNVSMPKYTSCPLGQLMAALMPELRRVHMPELTYCKNWFEVRHVPKCDYINARKLTDTGGMAVHETAMTRVSFPKLSRVRCCDYDLRDNPELIEVYTPAVTRIDSTLTIQNNVKLASLSLPLVTLINQISIEMPVAFKMILMPQLALVQDTIHIIAPGFTALDLPKLVLGRTDAFASGAGLLSVADVCCVSANDLLTRLYSTKTTADSCRASLNCYCPGSALLNDTRAYLAVPVNGYSGTPSPNISCLNGYTVVGVPPTCQLTGAWVGAMQQCVCQGTKFPINNNCRDCPKGCAACEACSGASGNCVGGMRCLSCRSGWTNNTVNGAGVCCAGSTTCDSQNRLSCLAGGLFGDSCGGCKPGYRQEGTNCVACPPGCSRCDATTCFECAQYYSRDESTGFCCVGNSPCQQAGRLSCTAHGRFCEGCREGYYTDRGMCKACPFTCSNCTGPLTCQSCRSQYQLNSGMCCNGNCAGGITGICTSQGGMCTGCPPGKFQNISNACTACPSKCATCTAKNDCTTCEAGFVPSEGRCCGATTGTSCTAVFRLACAVSGQPCGACLLGYYEQGGVCKCSSTCVNGGTCGLISDGVTPPFGGCTCPVGYTGRNCETWAHLQMQDLRGSLMLGEDRTVGVARTDQGTLLFAGQLTAASVDVQGALAVPSGDVTSIFPAIAEIVVQLQYQLVQPQPVDSP